MIVFDVVQTVNPVGAKISSYAAGRHLVEHHAQPEAARRRAAVFNSCCRIDGISYDVVEVDELSPDRRYDD